MRGGRPEVSLVIPLFNEAGSLPLLAVEIRTVMELTGRDYETIYVDDGSTDGSTDVLLTLAREDERVRVIRLRRNCGQSAALAAGFHHARGAAVVTLDADLQNDPADIPRLLAGLDLFDVVCGVRVRRQDGWLRRASSRIANRIRNRVTRETITDIGCTLRVYRAEFLHRVPAFHGMHRFLPTLLRLAGARVTEMPVNHRPRLYGQPKYNIRNRILRALVDLLGVRWLQSRWIDSAGTHCIAENVGVQERNEISAHGARPGWAGNLQDEQRDAPIGAEFDPTPQAGGLPERQPASRTGGPFH